MLASPKVSLLGLQVSMLLLTLHRLSLCSRAHLVSLLLLIRTLVILEKAHPHDLILLNFIFYFILSYLFK